MEIRVLIPELLEERGWNAHRLARRSRGRISLSAAYRLAKGKWPRKEELEVICRLFKIQPGGVLWLQPRKRK